MAYNIDPRKVAGVVAETNRVLLAGKFNHGEVILGLAELIGRMIVEAAGNTIQADEMYIIAQKHLADTIKIGTAAKA